MEIQKGDRVLVNVAPFIGSIMRSNESIPCEVLDVDGIQVHVRAEAAVSGRFAVDSFQLDRWSFAAEARACFRRWE